MPEIEQAAAREAAIRETHAELHAGPCRPDGPSVICVLLARLATLERERADMVAALRQMEWDATNMAGDAFCSFCSELETSGHLADCELRHLLAPPAPAGGA